MPPKYIRVRARSANAGSGTAGWSLAGPVPACFLMDEEVMIGVSWNLRALFEVMRSVAAHRRLSPRYGSENRRAPGTTCHGPPGFGTRRIQSGCERGESGRGAVPAQLVHVVE